MGNTPASEHGGRTHGGPDGADAGLKAPPARGDGDTASKEGDPSRGSSARHRSQRPSDGSSGKRKDKAAAGERGGDGRSA